MKWTSMKEKRPDDESEAGWYVVLIGRIAHIAYFSRRNWARSWHIPDEWQDPTHYIKLDEIEGGTWSNQDPIQ